VIPASGKQRFEDWWFQTSKNLARFYLKNKNKKKVRAGSSGRGPESLVQFPVAEEEWEEEEEERRRKTASSWRQTATLSRPNL
jgi:hypothetical protein